MTNDDTIHDADRSPQSNPRRSLMVGAGWTAVGTVGSRLIVLIGMIAAARFLGKTVFGQLGMIQQCVMLFSVVVSYGLGLSGAKYLAELRTTNRDRAGRIVVFIMAAGLGVAVLSGGMLAALAPVFCEAVLHEPSLARPLMWSVPWLIFASLSLTMQGCLMGLFAFRAAMSVQLIESTVTCVLVAAGATVGLPWAVFGFGVGSAAGTVAAWWLLRTHIREANIPLRWDVAAAFREGRQLSDFWIPSTLAALVVSLANWMCPVLLVRQPLGFSELAVFNAASYWFNALSMLPNVLQRVGTVFQSSALGRNNAAESATVQRETVWINLLLIGGAACPLAVFSPQILGLFGPQFREGWVAMVLSLATALCLVVIKPVEQTLNSQGRAWLSLGLHVAFAGVYIVASSYLTPWGAGGLALARLAAMTAHAGLMSTAVVEGGIIPRFMSFVAARHAVE